MTTYEESGNCKFNIELKQEEGRYPDITLKAIEEGNIFDVAETIYNDCYMGDLGFDIKGSGGATCTVKTKKHSYHLIISEPSDFEDMLQQIVTQITL